MTYVTLETKISTAPLKQMFYLYGINDPQKNPKINKSTINFFFLVSQPSK